MNPTKYLLLISMLIATGCCTASKNNSSPVGKDAYQDSIYPVGVVFGSICCGTASDDFLKEFIKAYNNKNSTEIHADIAAGCGREGEFVILINIPENKKTTTTSFIRELEKTVIEKDMQNKLSNSSSGGIEVIKDRKKSDYLHCRLGIKKWLM